MVDDLREHPGSNTVVGTEPCPKCNSPDNLKRYLDGHAHCFSAGCNHHEPPSAEMAGEFAGPSHRRAANRSTVSMSTDVAFLEPTRPDAFDDIAPRKLKAKTLRNYGYFRAHTKRSGSDVGVHVAPYYNQKGELAAQKLRYEDKTFPVLKPSGYEFIGSQLFGQHYYQERYDRKVVVTEGEIDAMSVAQVVEFKYPCVSVALGADGAEKSCKANFRWLDRFQEIILWFDDDEKGRIASTAVAKLFKVGKVRIVKGTGYKDANEALMANKPGDIEAALYAAETFRPEGIVSPADCFADIEEMTNGIPAWKWPWGKLQEKTHGIRLAEVIYLISGTGMGKTTILHQTVNHLLAQDKEPDIPAPAKIGIMCFEDTRGDVQIGLLSVFLTRRLILRPLPREDLKTAHTKLFGGRRIEMFDPETAEWDFEAIMSYVRYMAKALDCNVIFIDPLSFIAAGIEGQTDERRALDKVARDFAKLAKELNIAIIITHHLTRPEGERGHEEGAEIILKQIRGSGGPANFSSTIIGLEGDQQGDAPERRRFRVLKNRRIGKVGVAGCVDYLPEEAIMVATDEDIPKRDGGGSHGRHNKSPGPIDY